jgi:hypothetical protein
MTPWFSLLYPHIPEYSILNCDHHEKLSKKTAFFDLTFWGWRRRVGKVCECCNALKQENISARYHTGTIFSP